MSVGRNLRFFKCKRHPAATRFPDPKGPLWRGNRALKMPADASAPADESRLQQQTANASASGNVTFSHRDKSRDSDKNQRAGSDGLAVYKSLILRIGAEEGT